MLEIELQAREQRARSGQLRVEVERIEFVILVADVQQSELDFSHAPWKTVTDDGIEDSVQNYLAILRERFGESGGDRRRSRR